MTYFLGRYYEPNIQLLLSSILEPADRFIDIGSNIGMIALHAAKLVTESGEVECFEPNPECVETLKYNLEINSITHVKVHPVGLSDNKSKLSLNMDSSHSATATFAPIDNIVGSIDVQVLVGDDIVLVNPKPVKLIKIDTEGFEFHVLRGLKHTLNRFHPLLITESKEKLFSRAGTSKIEIGSFLEEIGYKPYGISSYRKLIKYQLQLIPIENGFENNNFDDIFWVHNQFPLKAKIKSFICRRSNI